MKVATHTWYMVVRQIRNLMREPIWIAVMIVQPMAWLLLYGQLFKNVTRLGGFGTTSYITFLAPAIVVMNAFFGATWSGMSMIADLDRKVVERFLATPASRLSIVLSQVVFRLLGKTYDAAVTSSGYFGLAMGATPTAIAIMTAITKAHGASPRSFLVVPLVGAFFVDIANAAVLQTCIHWLSRG